MNDACLGLMHLDGESKSMLVSFTVPSTYVRSVLSTKIGTRSVSATW